MNELNQLILQSFDIISLILVFAFVLFDIKYPKIREQLERNPPPVDLKHDYKAYRDDLSSSLFINVLPLAVVYGVLLYLFLPLLVRVLATYQFSLWNFDFVQTAFLVVILLIVIFFGWSVYLGIKHLVCLLKKTKDTAN